MFKYTIDDDLSLKLLEPRDAARLFELTVLDREMLGEWLPWVAFTREAGDTENFIRSQLEVYAKGLGVYCGLVYQGQIAGCISLKDLNLPNRKVSIGYWLGSEYQGKGLITKACRALINYSFQELELNRVEIRAAVDNKKSRAVPERLGFTQEGVIRASELIGDRYVDHVVYGMLAGEWTS
ncbi:GNAT family N-acetyltransferase [Paenibacillus sp. J22TS3]|uniref:GNAT family N-acetyltransferase n=1 Tax=Paenibacillus sp. J22TS3 TaxID=2807192 RepID=UPI001B183F2C|nr:GNAT family protein [Paenibacillus sp. J22TS3]GIP21633.1 ribosomal-protein-L7/L12-serine acetyltransferase [Paenibacillus sp. J22TS3]